MAEIGEDHFWRTITLAVREARRTHGLAPAPATDTGEDVAADDAGAEERNAARSPDGAEPERPGRRAAPAFRSRDGRARDSRDGSG